MYSEEIFGNIAEKAIKINRYWQDNKASSKSIRSEIERVFKNEDSDFIDKAAYDDEVSSGVFCREFHSRLYAFSFVIFAFAVRYI